MPKSMGFYNLWVVGEMGYDRVDCSDFSQSQLTRTDLSDVTFPVLCQSVTSQHSQGSRLTMGITDCKQP